MSAVAEEVNQKNGWNIMIHVDGASGAFVAPFLYPELVWDFRLKNVVSINASGHKCASSVQPIRHPKTSWTTLEWICYSAIAAHSS